MRERAIDMNRARDEERGNADACGAADIGVDAVADGEHAILVDLSAGDARDGRECGVIDGLVRFAGIGHVAAEAFVELCEGARAVDDLVAAFDLDVGVCAKHRHAASRQSDEEVAVVVG